MSEKIKEELTLEEKKERRNKLLRENYRRKQEQIKKNYSYTGKTEKDYKNEAYMMLADDKLEKMTDEEIEKENQRAKNLEKLYLTNFKKNEKLRREEFLRQNADNPELIERFLLAQKALNHVQKSIEMANTMTYEEIYKEYREFRKVVNEQKRTRNNRSEGDKKREL